MKNVCRCLSNCINDENDLKLVILVDADFRSNKVTDWLPFINEGIFNNVSILEAVLKSLR